MFFTRGRKIPTAPTIILHRHQASILIYPVTPITMLNSPSRSTAKAVHWWADGTFMHPTAYEPFKESLPSCGYFPPSASYMPASDTSEDLPWATSAPPESDSTDTLLGYGSKLRRTGGSAKSLGQVRTIAKVAGKAVVKRRNNSKRGASAPFMSMDYHPLKRGGNKLIKKRYTRKADKDNATI
jgi:hypothetical protein